MNQVDISLYSKTKKHEAMTTNKTADIVLISTTSLILAPFRLETSTVASYYTREIYHYQPRLQSKDLKCSQSNPKQKIDLQ